jgi:hypothetical protein
MRTAATARTRTAAMMPMVFMFDLSGLELALSVFNGRSL